MRFPPRSVLVGTATKSTLAILSGLAFGLLAAGVCPAGSQASSHMSPPVSSQYRAMTTCHPRIRGAMDRHGVENAVTKMAAEQGQSGWRLADATAYDTPGGLCVLLIFGRP